MGIISNITPDKAFLALSGRLNKVVGTRHTPTTLKTSLSEFLGDKITKGTDVTSIDNKALDFCLRFFTPDYIVDVFYLKMRNNHLYVTEISLTYRNC